MPVKTVSAWTRSVFEVFSARHTPVWATLEVISSRELQANVAEGLREVSEGKVMRLRGAKEALEWLSPELFYTISPSRKLWDFK